MAANEWRCGAFTIDVSGTAIMGVLNLTPDSFSDGGLHADAAEGIAHARSMLAHGAAIIDIGGESTRPGAREVSVAQEAERVAAAVRALAADGACVSIDTRHPSVALECIRGGASVINDVSGFRDPGMVEVAAGCDAGVVIMHMLGEPGTMQDEPRYGDVVSEVSDYLARQAAMLQEAGVAAARIAVDPGIGFGKTLEHNLALLRGLGSIVGCGYPVVVGASRKRFIGAITGQDDPRERLGGSVAAALFAADRGASVVRVHDVRETAQALAVWSAARGSG